MSADIEKIVEIAADRIVDTSTRSFGLSSAHIRLGKDTARFCVQTVIDALTAAGYAIVPREPSTEMARAGAMAAPVAGEYREHGYMLSDYDRIYRAMVEAFSPVKGSER